MPPWQTAAAARRAAAATGGPFVRRYLVSGGALAVAAAAQLATFAILARALGPHQFGLYVQFTAGTAVAVQLCGLGASDSLIRRVSRERDIYPAMLGHSLVLVLASGALLVALGTPIVHLGLGLDPRAAVDVAVSMLLLVSNVVLVRLALLVETVFLSLGRITQANCSVVAFALARTLIAATAYAAFAAMTIAQWAVVQFCGILLYVLACGAWLRPLGAPRRTILRDEVGPGLFYASQFVIRSLRQNVDLLVLSAFLPTAMIGSYGVARRVMDASFLSIDAMNRLLYPRFARASQAGLPGAMPDGLRALVAAAAIGAATSAALFALAPLLPVVFGSSYRDLVLFLRALCGLIFLVAVWSVATDLLGASGHTGARAGVLNGVNLLAGPLILAASAIAAPAGTILALYGTEAATALAAWATVLALVRRARRGRTAAVSGRDTIRRS